MAILIIDSTRQLFSFNDDGTNPEYLTTLEVGRLVSLDRGDMAFVPLYGGRLLLAEASATAGAIYAYTPQGARQSGLDWSDPGSYDYTGVAYYHNTVYALAHLQRADATQQIHIRSVTPTGWGSRTTYDISGALLQDYIGMGYHATRQILLCDDGGLIYSYKLNTAATPDRWERNSTGDAQLALAVGETVKAFDVNDKTVHAVIAVPAVPPPNPKAARQEVRVYTLA